MSANVDLNNRPDYDQVLQDIADYVLTYKITSPEALNTARNCLMDTLGCVAWRCVSRKCTKHLGPIVEVQVPFGASGAGYFASSRPGQGCMGHWLHRALAGLQRHLAGGGVGASFGQPGRWPGGRSPVAKACSQWRSAAYGTGSARSHDHGP